MHSTMHPGPINAMQLLLFEYMYVCMYMYAYSMTLCASASMKYDDHMML